MPRKQISFEVSEIEHTLIKELAAQRRQSIKGLIFSALDSLIPRWQSKEKSDASKKLKGPV